MQSHNLSGLTVARCSAADVLIFGLDRANDTCKGRGVVVWEHESIKGGGPCCRFVSFFELLTIRRMEFRRTRVFLKA